MRRTVFDGDGHLQQTRELLRIFGAHRQSLDARYGELIVDPTVGGFKPDALQPFGERRVWVEHTMVAPYSENLQAASVLPVFDLVASVGLTLPANRRVKIEIPSHFIDERHQTQTALMIRAWLRAHLPSLPLGRTQVDKDVAVELSPWSTSKLTTWVVAANTATEGEARHRIQTKLERYERVMASGQRVDLLLEDYTGRASAPITEVIRDLAPLSFREISIADTDGPPVTFRQVRL